MGNGHLTDPEAGRDGAAQLGEVQGRLVVGGDAAAELQHEPVAERVDLLGVRVRARG